MNAKRITTVLSCSLLFVFFFYREQTGLNVLLMTLFLLSARFILYGIPKFNLIKVLSLAGLLLSTGSVVFHNGTYSLWIYVGTVLTYIGVEAYPELRSIHWAFRTGFKNMLVSPAILLRQFSQGFQVSPKLRFGLQKTYITIVPILVIYLFLLIYRASNDLFDEKIHQLGLEFSDFFVRLFEQMDFAFMWTLAIGLLVSAMFLFPRSIQKLMQRSSDAGDNLIRSRGQKRPPWALKSFTLKDEYRSGIFLFIILNIILLGLNISDLMTIWTGFTWEGELLRSMVHTGTYLLIVSILLSMIVVLYYFKGNLNFYAKNKTLKVLCSVWLIQNAFLALSVLVRNYHYISHYNLAYKRIGVIFFVLLCLLGLALIAKKILQRKTSFYVVSRMSTAVFITLVLSAIPNWDRFIAQYNLDHSDEAFVHFDYLADLSDGTLDILDIPMEQLEKMKQDQDQNFYSRSFYSGHTYLDAENFQSLIERRKSKFIADYTTRSWKEWNYADYSVYRKLEASVN